MFRVWLCGFVSVALAGCITNTQSTQNAQIMPVGVAAPARVPPQNPRPIMTPAARLANARTISIGKTTTTEATLILASPQSLARDCSPLGHVDAKVITPPEHGTIAIQNSMAFSNYTPGDPPYLCNAKKSPATLITYKSSPGFTGQDATTVQIFFPDGHAPTMLFHINVQ